MCHVTSWFVFTWMHGIFHTAIMWRHDLSLLDWGCHDLGLLDWGCHDLGYPDWSCHDLSLLDWSCHDLGYPDGYHDLG